MLSYLTCVNERPYTHLALSSQHHDQSGEHRQHLIVVREYWTENLHLCGQGVDGLARAHAAADWLAHEWHHSGPHTLGGESQRQASCSCRSTFALAVGKKPLLLVRQLGTASTACWSTAAAEQHAT